MQFNVGRDEGGGELGVCSGTSAGAPDLRGDVMQFLAVLSDAESVLRAWEGGHRDSDLVGDNGA